MPWHLSSISDSLRTPRVFGFSSRLLGIPRRERVALRKRTSSTAYLTLVLPLFVQLLVELGIEVSDIVLQALDLGIKALLLCE